MQGQPTMEKFQIQVKRGEKNQILWQTVGSTDAGTETELTTFEFSQ